MGSYAFAPQVGGIETVGKLLAKQWTALGHEVIVATKTQAKIEAPLPYKIHRGPSRSEMVRLLQWADVYFQSNVSLGLLSPWVSSRKPLFITHHTWVGHDRSRFHPAVLLKRLCTRFARNIAVSQAIADELPHCDAILSGPYDSHVFGPGESDARPKRDYLFVGRLVADKGVDVMIRALGELRDSGQVFTATIAGEGPARLEIEALIAKLSLADRVTLAGVVTGEALARCYRSHRILVVPSRWREPFGLVALEGMACGADVIVSDAGGLPEAGGPTARVFRNGDVPELARLMKESARLIAEPTEKARHLGKYSIESVAARYLEIFQSALEISPKR